MHVYLTGFMGAGKTTVGEILATLLSRPFVDLDSRIETRECLTIAEIFSKFGEDSFRRVESAVLRDLDDSVPSVVATGGGILSTRENRDWIKAHGTAVWLDVPFEMVQERLSESDLAKRPLFADEAAARDLYERRLPEYGDSDLRIEVSSGHSAADVAKLIYDILERTECDI